MFYWFFVLPGFGECGILLRCTFSLRWLSFQWVCVVMYLLGRENGLEGLIWTCLLDSFFVTWKLPEGFKLTFLFLLSFLPGIISLLYENYKKRK